MRILQITTDFGKGGAERVFNQLSIELSRRHTVIECVFNTNQERVYHNNMKYVSLNTPATNNFLLKIVYFFLRVYRLRKIKKDMSIDIAISHLEGADYVNILSKRRDRTIVCVHGSKLFDNDINGVFGWLRLKVLIPILYRRADKVVTVSKGIASELKDSFGIAENSIAIINNFFNVNSIQQRSHEPLPADFKPLLEGFKCLLTSGRLVPQKNPAFLLLLFSEIKKKHPHIKLLYLGEGYLLANLLEKAQILGLKTWQAGFEMDVTADVFFVGYQKNPFAFLSRANVFLFPSLWEGMPLALCEAIFCGTTVVASDCPTGPREILFPELDLAPIIDPCDSGLGYLMPNIKQGGEEHVKNWVEVVDVLLSRKYSPSIAKRNAMTSKFSTEVVMSKWFYLIDCLA